MKKDLFFSVLFFALLAFIFQSNAQDIPSPKSYFGFNIGDNYQLANFTRTEKYFQKLASTSDRVKLVTIGKTEEGRNQPMLIISSPENLKNLSKYKSISQKLARAKGLSIDEAKNLANQGKVVVWIDGGLHANETVGIHQLIQLAYNLASKTDEETIKILENVIVLVTHANPDGQELQSNWYMREKIPEKRSISGLPRLYEKYAGHDNNRDFFMLNLKESQNIAKQLYIEWNPQIMYNHHQSAPAGTIVAGPPFRDPHNYVFDPVVLTSLDAIGAAIHNRLNVEDKPGYTQRNGSVFSNWYNGGLRTTTYFHNIIGILTETIGNPTPMEVPLKPERLLSNGDSPNPASPRKWYFQNAIDYSISMNYAVLNYAQRYHDELLYNMYKMGLNSIERGSQDTWSITPQKIENLKNVVAQKKATDVKENGIKIYNDFLKDPSLRDARAYIIPANQPDFNTAIRFLNALIGTGIEVQKAIADFDVEGKKYPKGSFIVKTNQAFRPHILDMFEPQNHPNDFKYVGGPPIAPYDAAGWTLAYLMNVKFDRILNNFDCPFQTLPLGEIILPEKKKLSAKNEFILSAKANNSFLAVNELLKAQIEVKQNPLDGSFHVKSTKAAINILNRLQVKAGVQTETAPAKVKKLIKIKPARIALWDKYGGSMPSGWIRYIMEQYNFQISLIYPPDIDRGNLNDKYDVIILVGGSIPNLNTKSTTASTKIIENIPEEYKSLIGEMTIKKSIPQLKAFIENGGKVITIGSATNLALHLKLPLANSLTHIVNGEEKKLSNTEYYIPGSVLSIKVDTTMLANAGLDSKTDVYFDNNPVFKLTSKNSSVKPLAWFDSNQSLRSGWALGQEYLKDGIVAFEANVGKGKLIGFSPEITFRAQTYGTFKWLFNRLYLW